MPTQIFISHSVAPGELAIVTAVADVAASHGAMPIISYRDWNPSGELSPHVASQINNSNYVIGIITDGGHHLDWVNAEIIYSQKMNKPILILADPTTRVVPQFKAISIDRTDPLKTISTVSREIQGLIRDESTRNLVGGLVISGITLLLLASLKKEE